MYRKPTFVILRESTKRFQKRERRGTVSMHSQRLRRQRPRAAASREALGAPRGPGRRQCAHPALRNLEHEDTQGPITGAADPRSGSAGQRT